MVVEQLTRPWRWPALLQPSSVAGAVRCLTKRSCSLYDLHVGYLCGNLGIAAREIVGIDKRRQEAAMTAAAVDLVLSRRSVVVELVMYRQEEAAATVYLVISRRSAPVEFVIYFRPD
jgi:hypothetical protein